MSKCVKISDDLYLVEQQVVTTKVVKKREAVNHIWIYDRSYSMSYDLPELTAQLKNLSKELPKGDTLTLGWFSGEGDYNFIIKGFKITDDSDYDMLQRAIGANEHPIGTTCFSEILDNTETVINDLSIMSNVFSLHFFTDGYPVVSNYRKEIDNIFSAISKIQGKIHTAMLVGYGSYYNKELMGDMAEKLGALLIHSSMIPEYKKSITKLVELTESLEPKEEVTAPVSESQAVFMVTDQGVVTYRVDDDGKLYVSPQKDKETYLYYVTKEQVGDLVDMANIDFADENDNLAKAIYGACYVLTQRMKTDIALEVMGNAGDKSVIDGLTNAFTLEEYGNIEGEIEEAIHSTGSRFSKGRDTNYLPPVDAFCVFDLITMLMEDEEAAFYPYHDGFQYERVGVKSKSKEEVGTKFTPNKESSCPLTSLTWHKSRLNLSVLAKVSGTVELQPTTVEDHDGRCEKELTPEGVGFTNPYPSFVWRNYTFIKDGRVNVKKVYITASRDTYSTLKNKGVVVDDTYASNKTFAIDLSSLPAINRAMAEGKTSATELCQMVFEAQELKAKTKALKWLKKEEFPEAGDDYGAMSPDQVEILKANHLDVAGLFKPPTEKGEAKDCYIAKAFEIKIKKLQSLPTVKKVKDKMDADKNRTPVETLVEAGLNSYYGVKDTLGKDEVRLKWLDSEIDSIRKQSRALDARIQSIKFAVIMGKKWFDEMEDRDNPSIEVDGKNFDFVLKEETVNI